MRLRNAPSLILTALICACGGDSTTAPAVTALSFTFDASTCLGTGAVDLFIDGAKAVSTTATAGVASQAFPVAPGSHVISATATATGSTWASEQVTVPAGVTTTFVLPCTDGRQLAPFSATLQNYLALSVGYAIGTAVDTIGAATGGGTPAAKSIQYVGSGAIAWSPAPARYSDGTKIPDDGMVVSATLYIPDGHRVGGSGGVAR